MSAADFLLSPEVQKILQTVSSEPTRQFSVEVLSKKTKLAATDVTRTLEHLVKNHILNLHSTDRDEVTLVSVNTSFVFYAELRRIALKSFAAAEPIRKMLHRKFKASVVRAFLLGEDDAANVELLVVHGELVPDQSAMSAACRQLSSAKLEGKDSQSVVNALIKNARKLPQELYKSLTWDRGTETATSDSRWPPTSRSTSVTPRAPWQRGSNENTNGLLRQYMPKGIDISGSSQLQLNAIARQLNERPRKTLGFHTPAEMFSECVAATG